VRRFAARCQSDPELEREAVEQYGIVLCVISCKPQRPLKRPPSISGTHRRMRSQNIRHTATTRNIDIGGGRDAAGEIHRLAIITRCPLYPH
jgi:hypothetical protein